MSTDRPADAGGRTGPFALFRIFLGLGCTAFGGPVAHLGYFREAFVARRGWFAESAYADLVALAQFLPGPASSQVGMAIGLARGGLPGMLASWLGFTLPSAALMTAFAYGVGAWGDALGGGWIGGLKAAAAAVVVNALFGMARTLAPDGPRAGIAAAALAAVAAGAELGLGRVWVQVGAILLGGLIGLAVHRDAAGAAGETAGGGLDIRVPRPLALAALGLFAALLVGLPVLASQGGWLGLADLFYRAGALVFGGGHVVLPLLEAGTVGGGLVDRDGFLAGYGAAQAMPGPLFTVAAYLGGAAAGIGGAMVALVAIFLPSALLLVGVLPFWAGLRRHAPMRRALAGVNAAVVGLLAAAVWDPILVGLLGRPLAPAVAAAAFVALVAWRWPPWAVVVAAGAAGGLVL